MGSPRWREEDKRTLSIIYPNTSNEVLAEMFGKSQKAIGLMARSLHVYKSPEFLASSCSRIKPGQAPWNKGVKGSTGTHQKCRASQFKQGRPASDASNYKPIGSLRVTKDGYLEKKMTDDRDQPPARRWVPLHRLVWESAHGPLPNGCVVAFRPGMKTIDPDAVTLEKLECITRAENMRRNAYQRYGAEVASLIQLRGVITRQINKREMQEAGHE